MLFNNGKKLCRRGSSFFLCSFHLFKGGKKTEYKENQGKFHLFLYFSWSKKYDEGVPPINIYAYNNKFTKILEGGFTVFIGGIQVYVHFFFLYIA